MHERTDQATLAAEDACPACGHAVGDAWMVCAWCGEALAAPAELAPGASLANGRYRIVSVLGRGGFGITYDAVDARLQRAVAVKELFPEAAVRHGSMVLTPPHARASFRSSKERFTREAQVLARFTHPGVVRVYEVFEEHGTAYLVMERLTGRTLVDVLLARRAPFDAPELLDVAGRVAAAMRPIHAAGVLHRDINPSNVVLDEHGRIVLIDFGLARDFVVDQTTGMTRVVTPGYAPLEQYQGEARFGPATDVYGLSALLYRLATGRVPVAAVDRASGAELPAPRRLNPEVPKDLSDAILDGLELDPGHRPQDMDSLLARLGVRQLPEGQRSVLLGSPGAEVEALHANAPAPVSPAPPVPPAPPVDLVLPGDEAPLTELAGPDHVATELVGRAPLGRPPAEARTVGIDASATAPDDDATGRGAGAVGASRPVWASQSPVPPHADAPEVRRRQRRMSVLPAALAVVALGGSLPVLIAALLVLVAFPLLATVGDHQVLDAPSRVPTPVLVPARFVRNVGTSVLRSSPIIGVSAIFLALWYGLAQLSIGQGTLDVLLRLVGTVATSILLLAAREGSPRFRVGVGVDAVADRLVPGGRFTQRVAVGWVVCLAVATIGLWLVPDPWPLP